MKTVSVGVVGAAGYVGGELLRMLLQHPNVEVTCVTSRAHEGEFVYRVHPNLRGYTNLKFVKPDVSILSEKCDIVFSAAPHGAMLKQTKELLDTGLTVIDLSADYRLKDPSKYVKYYGFEHPYPELLEKSVYGLPELHRDEIKKAKLVACPGCTATAAILSLAPLAKLIDSEVIVVDAMEGSSARGASPSQASHHPERSNVVRPYKPVGHRHTAEIEQELKFIGKKDFKVALSTIAVDIVRGILTISHVFADVDEKSIWRSFREFYRNEPFVIILRDYKAKYRLPDPKIAVGTNRCYVGFEVDKDYGRVVTLAAIDNLIKGAAGNAIQSLNIILGVDERTALDWIGYHPI